MNIFKKYGFLWVTLVLFAGSLVGHWVFGWLAYVEESRAHDAPIQVREYVIEMSRDTLENWQSEFLQLIWQVVGLAVLLYVGSSQSKESDERLEAKIDFLMDQAFDGIDARKRIDQKFLRKA